MTTSTRSLGKTWLPRILIAAMTCILAAATLAGIVLMGAVATSRSTHQPVHALANHAAATPAGSEGGRLVVAFVAGSQGTIASDLLAPYDVFASSSAFSTYVVADRTTPVPLEGGPAVVPTYTFAGVDADPALTPDLVVVPGLSKPEAAAEAPLRAWVIRQHDRGARVMGVCSGSLVLAATGMLDGLEATSHWSRISALEAKRPAVHWVRGRRYVEDGSIVTTAAVTSGVPAALHLVTELAGTAEAQRVADRHPELGWTPTESTEITEDHFAAGDWPVGLNYVLPWFRPAIGIALRDGVDELDATAAFEVYSQSAAARTVALATRDSVRTSHGLVLLTTRFDQAPHLSRVVVPDASSPATADSRLRAWACERGIALEPLVDRRGRGGFRTALQNLADHTDGATASATAKMIGYPTADLRLGHQHRSWRTALLAVAGLALAVLVGVTPAKLVRRRRRRRLQPAG